VKLQKTKSLHKVFSYFEIASAAGVKGELQYPRIIVPERRKTSTMSILKTEKIITQRPIVCIHPGASVIYKKWTEEGFAKISDWLIAKDFQVVFVGGEDDVLEINKITSRMSHNPFNLANKLSLGELTSLFGLSSLFIGNDSGPMHLASAVGVPVIALFGSANENRWGPLCSKKIILRGTERCNTCTRKNCQIDFSCIRSISPDTVIVAIEQLMEKN
jgi:ADP-heptose:LPS heptosyltransferase